MNSTRPPSIGLVLGAGGVAGFAYTVGVLAALSEVTGWDPRTAHVVVGTSAGAGVAALLRAGLSAEDHLSRMQGTAPSEEGRALLARLPAAPVDAGDAAGGTDGASPSSPPAPSPSPLPAAPLTSLRGLLRWPPRPGLAVAGATPAGRRSTSAIRDRYAAALPQWPVDPLWICAVRLGDGRRVTFGRDDHDDVDVGTAVAASCAVPGVHAPVEVGGERYVDGAVWSSTSVDLLTGVGFDAVVAVAPLSATREALGWNPSSAQRLYHRTVLESEVRRIERTGTPVLVLEPAAEDLEVAGRGGGSVRQDVAAQAQRSARAHLDTVTDVTATLTAMVPA